MAVDSSRDGALDIAINCDGPPRNTSQALPSAPIAYRSIHVPVGDRSSDASYAFARPSLSVTNDAPKNTFPYYHIGIQKTLSIINRSSIRNYEVNRSRALIAIAGKIKEQSDMSVEDAFQLVMREATTSTYVDNTIELIRVEMSGFDKSGPAGRGLVALANRAIALLEARKENLFFEIDAFKRVVDPDVLPNLISKYPPCPILQVEENSVGLVLLGQADHDRSKLEELAAAQALSKRPAVPSMNS